MFTNYYISILHSFDWKKDNYNYTFENKNHYRIKEVGGKQREENTLFD